jgi:hypothetical protein
VLTGTATASGQSAAGTPEDQTNNNTPSANATAHSTRCEASGAGALSPTKRFRFAARPLGNLVVGSASYFDLTPGASKVLVSVRAPGIACFKEHARIFGRGFVGLVTPVAFRLDVDDLGAGPGTDRFSITWPGYTVSGEREQARACLRRSSRRRAGQRD